MHPSMGEAMSLGLKFHLTKLSKDSSEYNNIKSKEKLS